MNGMEETMMGRQLINKLPGGGGAAAAAGDAAAGAGDAAAGGGAADLGLLALAGIMGDAEGLLEDAADPMGSAVGELASL
jgi:hypothetical protein